MRAGDEDRAERDRERGGTAVDPTEHYLAGEVATAGLIRRWTAAPGGASAAGGAIASPVGQLAWAVYEWARNPYVLLITIYVFSPYFTKTVVGDPVRGQALWGDIAALAGFAVAAGAPFLGAIADAGGRRKPWIAACTALIVASALMLWTALPGSTGWALVGVGALVALCNIAFEFSAVFHNSMLPTIAPHARVGSLSGLGLALGNAAGILLLVFLLVGFVLPGHVEWGFVPARPLFGIDAASHEPERLAGPMVAIWLLVFSMPLFFLTPDRASNNVSLREAMVEGVRSVVRTVRSLRHYSNVAHYLGARAVFNDGMTGVLTFSGIYAAGTFDWGPLQMTAYGIELSIFAVLGGFLGGWLDDHLGSKRALLISIGGTALGSLVSLTMGPDRILWVLPFDPHQTLWAAPFFNTWPQLIFMAIVNVTAVCITAGYANSRTMLARIAPPDKMTEFFGLYSLSGMSTAFMAPLGVSVMTALTHSQRGGMLAISVFLFTGVAWMALKVKVVRTSTD